MAEILYSKNTYSQALDNYSLLIANCSGLQTEDSYTRIDTEKNNYLFNAGSKLNEQTGNYEMFFREYDPVLGRMTAVDPMAGKYRSLTPYNYAFNDPIYWNDPWGADPGQAIFLDESGNLVIDFSMTGDSGGTWNPEDGYSDFNTQEDAYLVGYDYNEQHNSWGHVEGGRDGAMNRYAEATNRNLTVEYTNDMAIYTLNRFYVGENSRTHELNGQDFGAIRVFTADLNSQESGTEENGYGDTFLERLTNGDLWLKIGKEFLFGDDDPNTIEGEVPAWLLPGGSQIKLTRTILSGWRNVNFQSVANAIRYHVRIHGEGRSIAQYTNDALNLMNEYKHLAKVHLLKNGEWGYKINAPNGMYGIYDKFNKVVSFGYK